MAEREILTPALLLGMVEQRAVLCGEQMGLVGCRLKIRRQWVPDVLAWGRAGKWIEDVVRRLGGKEWGGFCPG